MYTAISRKVVGKKCARDNPERWYGIRSIHCFWHCSFRTYFCCFPLALANIRPWPLVPFFWTTVNSKPPTIPFGFVACTFSDNLSPNSCIQISNTYLPEFLNILLYVEANPVWMWMFILSGNFLFETGLFQLLSSQAFERTWGWWWLCFERNISAIHVRKSTICTWQKERLLSKKRRLKLCFRSMPALSVNN